MKSGIYCSCARNAAVEHLKFLQMCWRSLFQLLNMKNWGIEASKLRKTDLNQSTRTLFIHLIYALTFI